MALPIKLARQTILLRQNKIKSATTSKFTQTSKLKNLIYTVVTEVTEACLFNRLSSVRPAARQEANSNSVIEALISGVEMPYFEQTIKTGSRW